MAFAGVHGRCLPVVLAASLVSLSTGIVQTCPGEGRFPPTHSCNQPSSVFKVCAKLLTAPGSSSLQMWGSKNYFAWMGLPDPSAAVGMMQSNGGDSACVSLWTFASVVGLAGCPNVHINCDATDAAAMLSHFAAKGMTSMEACVRQHCPTAVANAQTDTLGPADTIGSLTPSPSAIGAPAPAPTTIGSASSPGGMIKISGAQQVTGNGLQIGGSQDPRSQAAPAPTPPSPAPAPSPSAPSSALPQLSGVTGGTVVSGNAQAPAPPNPLANLAAGGSAASPTPSSSSAASSSGPDADPKGFVSTKPKRKHAPEAVGGFILLIIFCCCGVGLCYLFTQHSQQMKDLSARFRERGLSGLQGMGGIGGMGLGIGGQYAQPGYGQPGHAPQMMDQYGGHGGHGGGFGAYGHPGTQSGSFSAQGGNIYGPQPPTDSWNHQQHQQHGMDHYGQGGGRDHSHGDYYGQSGHQQGQDYYGHGGQSAGGFQHDAYRRHME